MKQILMLSIVSIIIAIVGVWLGTDLLAYSGEKCC